MAGLEKGLARTGRQLTSVGADLTRGLTLPLAAVGLGAAKMAIDFESSFAGVRKTVNASEAEFAGLSRGLRDMAKEMPVNVNELNRIAEAAGQLGIGKNDILDFTRTMAMLGETTNLSADQAATSIAQIQNIYNASGKETSNFASALVALGNAGASTEANIVEMAGRIAGAANQIGISQAETLGFASALANLGINAEAGGTAISRVMSSISVAVDTGGEKLAKFAEVAGMSSQAYANLFKADASEAVTKFVEGLGRAKDAGGNLTAILKDLGQGDIRVMDALKRMAGAGDQLRGSLDLARGSWKENSALSKEYGERANTTASQLAILWNRAKDVGIVLGTAMLPVIKELVTLSKPFIGVLESMVTSFTKLPLPVQAVAFGLAGLMAAAGPIIYIAGTLIQSWGAVAGAFKIGSTALLAFTGTSKLAAGSIGYLSVAFKNLALAVAAFSAGWAAGKWLDTFTIGGMRPSEWIEFLAAWKFGITGIAAEDAKLAIQLRNRPAPAYTGPSIVPIPGRKRLPSGPDIISGAGIGDLFGDPLRNAEAAAAAADPLKKLEAAIAGVGLGAKAAKPELSEFDQAVNALAARLRGSDVVGTAQQWVMAIERIGGIGKLTHAELTQFTEDITKAVEKMRALGQEVPRTWALIADSQARLAGLQADRDYIAESMKGVPINRQQLLIPGGERTDYGLLQAPMLPKPDEVRVSGVTLGQEFKAGWSTSMAQMPQLIVNAFTGGGNVGRSIGALLGTNLTAGLGDRLGQSLAGMFGKTIGGALGSVIPGLGTLLGGLIGPLIGKLAGKIWGGIQSLFGNDEEARSVNPARDAFLDQFGGFSSLAAKLTDVTGEAGGGALFQALTQADTMEEFNAATAAIQARLSETAVQTQEITAANDTFNMSLTGSDEAIAQLGQTQLTVTEMMLQGFDKLIVKLAEITSQLYALGSAFGVVGNMSGSLGNIQAPSGVESSDGTVMGIRRGEGDHGDMVSRARSWVESLTPEERAIFDGSGATLPDGIEGGGSSFGERVANGEISAAMFGGQAPQQNITIEAPVTINARYVTSEDTWIREQVAPAFVDALASNARGLYSSVEHIVREMVPGAQSAPAIP